MHSASTCSFKGSDIYALQNDFTYARLSTCMREKGDHDKKMREHRDDTPLLYIIAAHKAPDPSCGNVGQGCLFFKGMLGDACMTWHLRYTTQADTGQITDLNPSMSKAVGGSQNTATEAFEELHKAQLTV